MEIFRKGVPIENVEQAILLGGSLRKDVTFLSHGHNLNTALRQCRAISTGRCGSRPAPRLPVVSRAEKPIAVELPVLVSARHGVPQDRSTYSLADWLGWNLWDGGL
jgi:hypothetical protein